MGLNREHLPISTQQVEPQNLKAKKRYAAPGFDVLDQEQAKRKLAARALPGDEERTAKPQTSLVTVADRLIFAVTYRRNWCGKDLSCYAQAAQGR
jgi:hypothetical protein